jgi:hypothetical protein
MGNSSSSNSNSNSGTEERPDMQSTRGETTVWVVSLLYFSCGEATSGGYSWHYRESDARRLFLQEKSAWRGSQVYIRLVAVEIPATDAGDLYMISAYLDRHPHLYEYPTDPSVAGKSDVLPATAVSLVC